MNSESRVISGDGFCQPFHRRLELLMARVDVEPFLQDVVGNQLRELFDNCGLMPTFRADQDSVPLPSTGLSRFDQYHHLAAEEISGQSTEHPLGEEAGMILEGLKDPFVVEGLQAFRCHLFFVFQESGVSYGDPIVVIDGFEAPRVIVTSPRPQERRSAASTLPRSALTNSGRRR